MLQCDGLIDPTRLHNLLKYGLEPNYWNEFVFKAYHHHQHDAVFLREWSDRFKLGKSAFVKRDLRLLPLTEAEFDADFFFDRKSSSKDQESWIGLVIGREFGGLLAIAKRIARHLAEALGVDPPVFPID